MEFNVGSQTRVNHQMSLEVYYKRQPVKEGRIFILFTLEFFVSLLLRWFQFYILTVPTTPQYEIVIANDRRKPSVSHKQFKDLTALRTLGDEIAHRYDAVLLFEVRLIQ